MAGITTVIGIVGGIFGILTATFSVIYLRRQTLLMATQVDKEIEIKITRDLDESVEVDTKLRTFLNRRLSDVRSQLRQEFGSQFDEINRQLSDSHIMERRDIALDAIRLVNDGKDVVETAKESNDKVNNLEREIQTLQQTVEDIRNGVGNQAMVRTQIRGIAEQLLRMTIQE